MRDSIKGELRGLKGSFGDLEESAAKSATEPTEGPGGMPALAENATSNS